MPYMIVKKDDTGQFCVHKENPDKTPGDEMQCYDTRQEADDYMAALYANVPDAMKRGARNSSKDAERLQAIHDLAAENGATCPLPEPDIVNVEMPGANVKWAIKAVGDWELDVLGNPYGGPNNGKDTHKEFFSSNTKLHLDKFTPLVTYYHGFSEGGKPQGDPEIIGEVKGYTKKADGVWWHVALDKANAFAKLVWEAAQKGLAVASSGSVAHLARVAKSGEILNWPMAELALWDMTPGKSKPANAYAVVLPALKMAYEKSGKQLPDNLTDNDGEPEAAGGEQQPQAAKSSTSATQHSETLEDHEMDENDVKKAIAEALKADRDQHAADEASAKAEQEKIDAAVKAERVKWEAEAAKGRRLHSGNYEMPAVSQFHDAQYDSLSAGDQALLIGVLRAANKRVGGGALKSLAAKLEEDKTGVGEMGRQAMKMAGVKANEIDYSTEQYYGDEWVGIAYSQALWEAIRVATFVANRLPTIEFPQGIESMYLPLESTDPIFYNVAEATAIESTLKIPQATVTNSPLGTSRAQLTLAKLGARVLWTGEMEEGSLIPFVAQLRAQLVKAGAEYLESAIIDGDTTVSAANINDTAGGGPAATDWFTVFDGFRHSALITTAANSRSAAGALDVTDYIETVKLMGGAGINALDRNAVSFVIDPNTYWKSLTLPEVLTRDVLSSPTIEGGRLTGLWGYGIDVSGSMHKNSSVRKATTAGEIDTDTPTNNAYGAILAVRWDQWKLGWRRHLTLETTRIANADSTEIVAMMRVGLIQRDTEAVSETYYVGV